MLEKIIDKAFMVFWSNPWTNKYFAKYLMVDGDKLTVSVYILFVYFCDNICILLFFCTQYYVNMILMSKTKKTLSWWGDMFYQKATCLLSVIGKNKQARLMNWSFY